MKKFKNAIVLFKDMKKRHSVKMKSGQLITNQEIAKARKAKEGSEKEQIMHTVKNTKEDFRRIRKKRSINIESNIINNVCRQERKISKGYIDSFEKSLEVKNEKELERLLMSKERRELLYNISITVHEDGLENECAGLINYWDDDDYIKFILEELSEKTGLPAYWIIEQAKKILKKSA
jgi:hypothetical protein